LTGAARQVAGGNFQTRVTILNKDEFKELGTAFNSMTGQVHRLFTEVSRQKEELIQMIASIREGLVVMAKDGKITLTNDSFKELIGEKTPEGKFHWEVIRRPKIQEFIERAMACGGLVTEEVRLDERYLLCTAGSLGPQGGLIITFHDLSDVKRVEAMKKDFIVNASHELRTPLSAIMGAMETLEDDGSCDDKATLDILKRHVERLRNIVDDLLRLSELEDKGLKLDIKDIDIRQVADSVLQLFSARFKDKGLTAEIRAAADLPRLRADAYQVEQMLINLVDNAVKYTEKGGVVISLKADPREFAIDVEDTGYGIAPEHLPRLFERFYVVDKSRSRKLGGTGLGLAIVKHIVQLHGGTITVASKEGKGTTFTVRIPSN
jgi:two-component system phosphate regulon sensor histidine kinase PhoR